MLVYQSTLQVSGGGDAASEKQIGTYKAFQGYTSEQYFYSIGGDYSKKQSYHEWLSTVKEKPAPISTTLAPLSDILPMSKHFQSAYDAYLSECPSTKEGGVCNGLGSCTSCKQDQAYCTCGPGSYLEDDGTCYPICPGDNGICNGRGDCYYGKCQCKTFTPPPAKRGNPWSLQEPFSYKGPACETKCGSFTFDANRDHEYLGLPGTDHSPHGYALDDGGVGDHRDDPDGELSCFCQKKTGVYDEDMKATYSHAFKAFNRFQPTYSCIAPEMRICRPPTIFDWCWHLDVVRCQFGDKASCSEDK